ncbi:MAG: cache domain-containing protein [Campylobacterota bacterium]|nr:cache domain-containing protein [Campylobacterota bacterium]
MKKSITKTKQFLIPILVLVITSIVVISVINTYLNIGMFQTHMEKEIIKYKKEYLQKQQNKIYQKVYLVDNSIKFQITLVENKLKKELKERIETALNIANYVYKSHKGKYTKKELRKKVASYLDAIRFNDNRGYYFSVEEKTNIIVGHAMKKFLNKDMTNVLDPKGLNMIDAYHKALEKEKIAFVKVHFNKPSDITKEYPKIVAITKFEPLDLIIGTGEYLDVKEEEIKNYVLNRFEKDKTINHNSYLFFLDLHNINGGDEFATMILNPNRPDLIGKKLSDSYKDKKGKEFRKEFLKNIREKGESYTKYWYKTPSMKKPKPKMSYFYLQKDWNWIITSGFYYDDLDKQIIKMEKSIHEYTTKTILDTLLWVFILSLIVIIIAIYVSVKIDKTIKKYADKLIINEKLMHQQSKMVSMGEMIGNIAHQWRQPLSVISTAATGMKMQKEFGALEDEHFNKMCDAIDDNAQYLSKTIDDFKNFIKGERVKSVFNIKDEIGSFLNLVEGSIKSHHINLILDMKNDINIDGYQNELTQCLINIFNNAKDVLKELEEENRLLFITTSQENDNLIIKFKDSGGGIPDDIISKIFDPYFTTKHKSQGTGLGLNMTYQLITEGMGGKISASTVTYTYNDKSYIGAEFIVTLPLS